MKGVRRLIKTNSVKAGALLVSTLFASILLVACNKPAEPANDATTAEPTSTDAMMKEDSMMEDESNEDAMMEDKDAMMEDDNDAEMDAAAKTIEVEGGSFYYKPNKITVKKGEKVTITLKSVDMMHDFVIDELNVKSDVIKSGDTGTVSFVADKVGTYEFYCSVGQHRANGMVGTLVVEE